TPASQLFGSDQKKPKSPSDAGACTMALIASLLGFLPGHDGLPDGLSRRQYGSAAVQVTGQLIYEMEMSKIAIAVIGLAVGAGASAIYAQSTAPYYEVVEINVKDQTNYEKSGVDKVRETMKTSGGKIIAGGYNKATYMGAAPANRFLIIQYASKEGSD